MKAKALSVFAVAGLVGSAVGGEEPTRVDPSVGQVKHVAHIYYNIATGEKITTLMQDGVQSPADGAAGSEIWIANIGAQCESQGDLTSYFWSIDRFSFTTSGAMNSTTEEWFFDWGDIAMDTVVDCVQVHWITNHSDTDTDLDGVGDGVLGFAGNWTYYDAFNGRGTDFACLVLPIISFGLYNLPGSLSDSQGIFPLVLYTMDVDLGVSGSFGTSMIFEIGDTDSDLQGAAFHNANLDDSFSTLPGVPDIDLDLDGLADWGWSLTFNQPGTIDVDNADGDSDPATGIDGDPWNTGTAGVVFGSPSPGHPEYDSDADSWSWVSDGPTAGKTEDMFTTAHVDSFGSFSIDGPWWFGGLACTLPGVPGSGYTPAAHFQTVLYGPGGVCVCPADVNADGVLDFFDISTFLTYTLDYNGDTVFDFFDIVEFLSDFTLGCSGCL